MTLPRDFRSGSGVRRVALGALAALALLSGSGAAFVAPALSARAATAQTAPSDGGSSAATSDPVPAIPSDCSVPTPEETEGPYFESGSPENAQLAASSAGGTVLTLTGYVVDTSCRPVEGALVDFWQADASGQYDNSGTTYNLRGHQYTDASGMYQLVTVVPGLYPGRTRHIHVKVTPPGGGTLTTQLYFPGEAQNARDGIFLENGRNLLMTVEQNADGSMNATYTFVVAAR